MRLIKRIFSADVLAVILLTALCWLFFWRLLTPNPLNQQSLIEGDFSGQFVTFAHYQAVRLGAGEVPLWNPYNYGGHPFLADTQSAVFYPPRLLTIGIVNLLGGSNPQRMYIALQDEMIFHTLLASLLMYAFVRRLTRQQVINDNLFNVSVIAALVAGITFAYGGYLTSYPQLQLAVMEAGIWIPLALLGIYEATCTANIGWRWFLLSGAALGLSFAAGHPQTTYFMIYMVVAYLGWQVVTKRYSWRVFVIGTALFGLIGAGLAAVQLIPGWEYTGLTVRTSMNVDAMGNGFPFYDVLQMIFPGMFSVWSPLYFGIVALGLVIYVVIGASSGRIKGVWFWVTAALVALALSFGHNTILYDLFYNLVPGATLFREQERTAYIVTTAVSVLAGLGTASLLTTDEASPRRYKIILGGIMGITVILGGALLINWWLMPSVGGKWLGNTTFSVIMATAALLLLTDVLTKWQVPSLRRWRGVILVALVVFELFTFGRTNPNLEARPAGSRLSASPLIEAMHGDTNGLYRVDGTRVPAENYGTLYGIQDIQGISPLRLTSIDRVLKLPPARLWEIFSVRYVPTENNELPAASTITMKQNDPAITINLHRLNDPRPFARLVYKTWIEPDANAALGIFSDPSFDARNTVILPADPGVALPANAPTGSSAEVVAAKPENITIKTHSTTPAVLSLSLVYYPGWQATVDGDQNGNLTALLRADTAFTALVVPAGDHTVQLTFRPTSYTVGGIISLITLTLVVLGALSGLAISYRRRNTRTDTRSAHS